MDIKKIKKVFPIFSHHKDLVYLDNAATYQKPAVVIDALSNFYAQSYASVHRGAYILGEQATEQYENTRDIVQKFINAQAREEVIFTTGTTESINFVADTWARHNLKPGDEILITQAEHHANLLPWQRVAQQTGAILKFIEIDTHTYMLPENPKISPQTKLLALTHVSNVLGNVWHSEALEQLIKQAHALGAKVLLDSAQAAAHTSIDVQQLQPDFMVFSGHKLMGPTGTGILYIRKDLHDHIEPYQLGGSMVNSVSYESATWAPAPHKFEAGTPAIASVIGLGQAITYIQNNIDLAKLAQHETALCAQALAELAGMPEITIAGNQDVIKKHGHIICFSVKNIHPHDITDYLSKYHIAVRAGHLCAQPLVQKLGFNALLRVSFGIYNTPEDVQRFLLTLKKAISYFKKL